MAHEIETYGDQAAFVSAREDAWHRLGTVTDDCLTAEEALAKAHLAGWNVRKSPATTTVNGVTLEIPGTYATIRDNPFTGETDVLGAVGEIYEPLQNEEHCEFLNTLVDESGAHFETAGSLRGGRNVFVTMKLPDAMQIGGQDRHDLYIAGLNSHDGNSSFQVITTPVRVVCANTAKWALNAAKNKASVRHTSGAKGKIEEVRRILGLTWKYLEEFKIEGDQLLETPMTNGEFEKTIDKLFPINDSSKRGETIGRERKLILMDLFTLADTQKAIRGTRWAGLQAVSEYLDHFQPVRTTGSREAARAERALVGTDNIRQKARDAFSLAA